MENINKEVEDAITDSAKVVLDLATKWAEKGPTSILDQFNVEQEFGVEIETFYEGSEHRELPNELYDWTNAANPHVSKEMVKLWAKIMMEEVPPEIISALANHSYNEPINTETVLTKRWNTVKNNFLFRTNIKLPDKLDTNNYDEALNLSPTNVAEFPPDFYRALKNTYSAAYLKMKAGFEVQHLRWRAFGNIIDKEPTWRLGYDSTISKVGYTISNDEIISPKLKGKDGLHSVAYVVNELMSAGFQTNSTCGAHTSINHTDGVGKYMPIISILLLVARLEPQLATIIPQNFRMSRSKAAWVSESHPIDSLINWCITLPAKDALNKLESDPRDKYRSINIGNYLSNGRVELRSWQCVLDPEVWLAQIVLSQKICEAAGNLSKSLARIRKNYRLNTVVEEKKRVSRVTLLHTGYDSKCTCDYCKDVREKVHIIEEGIASPSWFGGSDEEEYGTYEEEDEQIFYSDDVTSITLTNTT